MNSCHSMGSDILNHPLRGILAIGGSDPSAGAGIQADLKTITSLGVFGCAAITCLTAQDAKGVKAILPVEPSFVVKQIEPVLKDLPISHIKIGMIGQAAIARAIECILRDFRGQVICDPVLRASDGTALFEENALDVFTQCILGHATVITPNKEEFQIITGEKFMDDNLAEAVGWVFGRFHRLEAIALTGGHFPNENGMIVDRLFLRVRRGSPKMKTALHPRRDSLYTHGTGCTFASAYSAGHLITGNHEEAFLLASQFVDTLLTASAALQFCEGRGPVLHYLYISPLPPKRGKSPH